MKDHLKQLIAKGKTGQAIEELLQLTLRFNDQDLHQEVVHQSAQFEEYSKGKRLGIDSHEQQVISRNNINLALLQIIGNVPDGPKASSGGDGANDPGKHVEKGKTTMSQPVSDRPAPSQNGPSNKSIWLGIVALLGAAALLVGMVIFQDSLGSAGPLAEIFFLLLLGILAGVAFFEFMPSRAEGDGKVLGMNLKFSGPIIAGIAVAVGGYYFLQSSAQGPFGFTVSLQHDKSLQVPATYPILEEAKLQLRLGDVWKPADVDANGDAHFRGIAGDYKNHLVAARLDARYWALSEDSVKLIGKSQTLFLQPIGNLSKITGKVKDGTTGDPLPGVTVEVLGIAAKSGDLGNFELSIPLDKQRIEYDVNAYLKGFESFKGNATPATGVPMSILLMKK